MASNTAEIKPPSQMKAAYIAEYHKPYALGTRPLPSLRPTDILVRVHAAGFCHSDLQVQRGEFRNPAPLGLIPSHEIAGIVAELGAEYTGPFKRGDKVGVLNFMHACGSCVGCRLRARTGAAADPRFCDVRETAGFRHDGGFAEYVAADPETTVRIPESVSFDQAAPLMCAGATVWGSLQEATRGIDRGENVAIIGVGGLGHLALQFAKALGFRTIAIEPRAAGRRLATEMANAALRPDLVVDSSDAESASIAIYNFTNGEGVAAAVVCTASIEANRWALTLLRVGGVLGLLGLPQEPWKFDAAPIVFRELVIRGSYVCGREAAERMMETVEKEGVRSQLTVVPFERIPEIIDLYRDPEFRGRLVVRVREDDGN
ncbi:Putative Alcohol dehydrogenase [Aspergillus calidoustus]|uniref:Putative Alcohol dehydrogenase n=1 Tax=Aspergillus calidoustus TaxID=454130 RepID=A0A0U5G9G7_ASPCI|nr:Putative Alcohol dehydrogenase [Aspergillus calidoustus]